MTVSLYGRSFLKLLDFTPEEILYLIELASEFKKLKKDGVAHRYLEGKNVVLCFEKTSTRTRCSFEVAAYDLGMHATYLGPDASQMGKKESIEDTAKVLGSMYDGIEYRGFGQEIVETLAGNAGVPVWNGLTDEFHPTQMIADALTITECLDKPFSDIKLVFMGDACNNVANSLMVLCAKLGMDFAACAPADRMPEQSLVDECRSIGESTGSRIILTESVAEACEGADVIYTDIWLSMGEPEELWAERIEKLSPYCVTQDVFSYAPDAIFLHCLPSFHDRNTEIGEKIYKKFGIAEMEVTDEVFRSDRSKVFIEAENRMHSIKAIMYATLHRSEEEGI